MKSPQGLCRGQRVSRGQRLSLILVLLVGIYLAGAWGGFDSETITTRLRTWVLAAGMWAWLVFSLGFVTGVVLQVPGVVFVLLAPLLFPALEAWLLCLFAGNVAVNLNFIIVRKLGGQPLSELPWAWARGLLQRLEQTPIRSVFCLRLVFLMLPPVTGALALTKLSLRAHARGSFLGLLVPITVLIASSSWLLRW